MTNNLSGISILAQSIAIDLLWIAHVTLMTEQHVLVEKGNALLLQITEALPELSLPDESNDWLDGIALQSHAQLFMPRLFKELAGAKAYGVQYQHWVKHLQEVLSDLLIAKQQSCTICAGGQELGRFRLFDAARGELFFDEFDEEADLCVPIQ